MITQGLYQKPTFMENLKSFNVQGMMQNIQDMQVNWADLGMFAVAGALSGFLFKKYFHMFVVCVILGFGLIAGLDYFGLVHIDWTAFNSLFGVTQTHTVDAVAQSALVWVKNNLILVVGFFAGFSVGFKIG